MFELRFLSDNLLHNFQILLTAIEYAVRFAVLIPHQPWQRITAALIY